MRVSYLSDEMTTGTIPPALVPLRHPTRKVAMLSRVVSSHLCGPTISHAAIRTAMDGKVTPAT